MSIIREKRAAKSYRLTPAPVQKPVREPKPPKKKQRELFE